MSEHKSPRFHHQHKRPQPMLPPPHILQEYERLSEGATERLIEMAEIEQEHRHEWEDNCLRSATKSHRIGQIFGLIMTLAIVFAAYDLDIKGNKQLAMVIASGGFVLLIINSMAAIITRRMGRKPRKFVPSHQRNKEVKPVGNAE